MFPISSVIHISCMGVAHLHLIIILQAILQGAGSISSNIKKKGVGYLSFRKTEGLS